MNSHGRAKLFRVLPDILGLACWLYICLSVSLVLADEQERTSSGELRAEIDAETGLTLYQRVAIAPSPSPASADETSSESELPKRNRAEATTPITKWPSADITVTEAIAHTRAMLRRRLQPTERVLTAHQLAEQLKLRKPAANFVVTVSGDAHDDDLSDNIFSPQTLRAAVENANKNPDLDLITFAVSSVQIDGVLGSIVANTPVTIDGDPGDGSKVLIQGNTAGGSSGLWFSGGGSTIYNLEMTGGNSSAIALLGNGGNPNVVQGCVIHDWEGTGINFNFSTYNVIGGITAEQENVIYGLTGTSGNGLALILSSGHNEIIGNLVGTSDGFTAGANSRNGILNESSYNHIAHNVISGNAWSGISQEESGPTVIGTLIEYNYIGTTIDGASALGNGADQVGSGIDAIGFLESDTIRGNVVSANGRTGISARSLNALVEDNICGLDIDAQTALSNAYAGIYADEPCLIQNNISSANSSGIQVSGDITVRGNICGADGVAKVLIGNNGDGLRITASGGQATIGGPNPEDRNILSGNGSNGIRVYGVTGHKQLIENNYIGVDPSGNVALPNGGAGIYLHGGADSIYIIDNVISANNTHGIWLNGLVNQSNTYWSEYNVVLSNKIGVGADGTTKLGNGRNGIFMTTTRYSQIGDADSGNVIVANDSCGISSLNSEVNLIFGNQIGTLPTGEAGYGNGGHGVLLVNADQTDIGGIETLGNTIVANDSTGIALYSSSNNTVLGNLIGINNVIAPLGNALQGILLVDSDSNMIGGLTALHGNSIADQDSAGIALYGTSRENKILGNYIGIDIDTLQPPLGNRVGVVIRGGRQNEIGNQVAEFQNQILGNSEAGVIIEGDSNYVRANRIWQSIDDSGDPTGEGDGIRIDGSNNQIGGEYPGETNTIAKGEGTGVLVASGEGNTIRGNVIYKNEKLGIDLLPPTHVTVNDSADVDAGANELQNYPVVDSAEINNQQTTIFGHVETTDDAAGCLVEFFWTDDRDTSGYGEGDHFIDSLEVAVQNKRGDFVKTIAQLFDSVKALTMTATNERGSTSEFSACWPAKAIKLVDVDSMPIKGMEFTISKVKNNRPTLTETELGVFRTDSMGVILFGRELADEGDTLKARRKMWEEPTPKRPTILPIAYRVYLDNGKFDSSTSALKYKEVDTAFTQKLVMDHTTVAYNLYVSIEFDASPAYVQSLTDGLRLMDNYLYDVYDGQLLIDSVMISDDYLAWNVSDIRVRANNMQWPNSTGARLLTAVDGLKLPRRWFGNADPARGLSVSENPLVLTAPDHFRTLAHELGHYMIAFKDEYKYAFGGRCAAMMHKNYGYMDTHYDSSEPRASELSSTVQYTPGCKNTIQWDWNGGSCWYWYEVQQEFMYGDLLCPIIRPEERALPAGVDALAGPNEWGQPLDYDVGALLTVVDNSGAFTGTDRLVTVRDIVSTNPVPKAQILHKRSDFNRLIIQGFTSDMGQIIVLGASPNDVLYATGPYLIVKGNKALQRDGTEGWVSGALTLAAKFDGDELLATPIAGSYPLNVTGALHAGGFDCRLQYATVFPALPELVDQPNGGSETTYPFGLAGSEYTAAIPESGSQEGIVRINAVDDNSDPFFFAADYGYLEYSGGTTVLDLVTPTGDCEFEATGLSAAVDQSLTVSTDYIVRRDGIPADAIQSGRVHSLAVSPASVLPDSSVLAIRYDPLYQPGGARDTQLEMSLRIHRWNEAAAMWELVGGEADTTQEVVTANITDLGTFALFTTEAPVGYECGDADASGRIDLSDAIYLIYYIFAGGQAPQDAAAGDWDCSGETNVSDAVYMIQYIFAGGPVPCAACP